MFAAIKNFVRSVSNHKSSRKKATEYAMKAATAQLAVQYTEKELDKVRCELLAAKQTIQEQQGMLDSMSDAVTKLRDEGERVRAHLEDAYRQKPKEVVKYQFTEEWYKDLKRKVEVPVLAQGDTRGEYLLGISRVLHVIRDEYVH